MAEKLPIGFMVSFEGIDQSGKETQVAKLARALEEKGFSVLTLSSPDYETITGRRLKEFLSGYHDWDNIIYQSLMVTNRYEQQQRVQEALMSGKVVIYDRYIDSGMSYGMADGCSPQWLMDIQHSLVPQDLTILIDITVDESFKRKQKGRDAYESKADFLEVVREIYQQAAETLKWTVIDGMKTKDEIHEEILAAVLKRMEEQPLWI